MDELLDNAPCGFLAFTDDGVIVITNATLRSWVGYDVDELEGKHFGTILSPGGRIFYQTHFFPLVTLHGVAEEIYLALRACDGTDIPVLVNARRTERNGELVNDCVLVPMRQRRRYEDELLKAKRSAESATQAKAKFLSMMSHELRTPLHAISMYIQVLVDGAHGDLTDEQRADIEKISSASEYVLGLIDDLLGFAQLEAGRVDVKLEPVLLEAAIVRAEALVLMKLEEAGLTYSRKIRSGELSVVADPRRLQQILLNLLTNAVKFTPAHGHVEIQADRVGDTIAISVIDTGPGIAPEDLARIFEPFYQVERQSSDLKHQGAGLGLAISRELVRAMGGELVVESIVGSGSTFTITLPMAASVQRPTKLMSAA